MFIYFPIFQFDFNFVFQDNFISFSFPEPQVEKMDSESKTSWVYTMKKEVLIAELNSRGLKSSGTVDELRARLIQYIREPLGAAVDQKPGMKILPEQRSRN